MSNKVELLSPAGDIEGFYGAINAGADAVYLSGKQFGARAYAGNFSEDEIISCIRYAHVFSKKVYLTVNTLLKDNEIALLYDYLKPLYEAGLDAVIVQDIGVFSFIRKAFPEMDIHVSTQMTITGKLGCEELLKQGASRIVPARELSLEEIRNIKRDVPIEIECFVHGAMCYCYSGQCLFSSFLGERSGNRGRCAQPCRLPYHGDKNTEIYPLSLKDMNTLEHIPELIEAGIDSFKIEGRMKKPEYTAGVTAIYRKNIDLYYNNQFHGISDKDKKKLASLYTRSETESGYYFRQNGREMITIGKPSYNDNDDNLLKTIRAKYIEHRNKIQISMFSEFHAEKPAKLTLDCGELEVTVSGETVCEAQNRPVTEDNIRTQLNKLGDSFFTLKSLSVSMDQNIFMPIKAINELRRKGIALLIEKLIQQNGFTSRYLTDSFYNKKKITAEEIVEQSSLKDNNSKIIQFHIAIHTREQLAVVIRLYKEGMKKIHKIYISSRLLLEEQSEILNVLSAFCDEIECVIALPYITRQKCINQLKNIFNLYQSNNSIFHGFLIRNMEEYAFFKNLLSPDKLYLDSNMYIWNKETANYWQSKTHGFCLPLELKWDEQKELLQAENLPLKIEKLFYGFVPMMQTANCIMKTMYDCQLSQNPKKAFLKIKDRYQKEFFVYLNCNECYNTIYNSVPLSLHKDISRWKDKLALRLDFTIENEIETEKILRFFVEHLGQGNCPYTDYTTGHENRGVE